MKNHSVVRIVDDSPAVRDSVSLYLLVAGFQTACYSNAREFLDRDDFSRPGCVILDVRMEGMSGIELFDRMQQTGIGIPVIFLSGHGDIAMAVEAVKKGAIDFLVKPPRPEQLLALVGQACQRDVQRRQLAAEREHLLARWRALTPTEQQVAVMVAKGLTNVLIGHSLDISEWTVKTHRSRLYEKLDVENAVETADFLRQAGITEH